MLEQPIAELGADGVLVITLNNPAIHNALDLHTLDQLYVAITDANANIEVYSIVLNGAGPSFCAGDNLRGMGQIDGRPSRLDEELRLGHPRVIEAMRQCKKPIIAALHGWVLGAGCEIALAADLRVCDSTTKMGIPYILRGMAGGTAVLVEMLGFAAASQMLLTGEPLNAVTLQQLRVVHSISAPGDHLNDARTLAVAIGSHPPYAFEQIKQALNAHWSWVVGRGVLADNFAAMAAANSPDQIDAIEAFLMRE